MLRKTVRIAVAMCLLPVSSCAATKCDDYKYLAFEPAPSMTILETRVPALSGLRGVKPIPVLYVLKRKGYRIVVRTYEKDYGPTATLLVNAADPMTLKPVGGPNGDTTDCIVAVELNGNVKFTWLGKAECTEQQRIRVAVVDGSGAQVSIEELSFTVVTNGRYCVKDAL